MKKILTISVAAYNLGDMILTNLKSICESSVAKDIEVIVTDDGSKDNTADIVQEYANSYPDVIKLIRKKNEGPGSTVNCGIKHATGKYFRMIDGDDWVVTDNMQKYIELLKDTDADLIVSDFVYYDNSNNSYLETVKSTMKSLEVLKFSDVYKDIPMFMHCLTFKTSIFQNNNIVLDNCFYTDVEYMLLPIPFVNTVVYYDKTIYVYRIAREGQSVSIDSMKRNVAQHGLVLNNLITWYNKQYNLTKAQRSFIIKRLFDMARSQLTTLCLFDANKQNKCRIKDYLKDLKTQSPDVFEMIKKKRMYRMLVWSNYLLYPLLVKILKKRIK